VTCGDNQHSLAPLLTTVRAPESYLSQECYITTDVVEHVEEITDYCNTSPAVNLLSPNKVRPQWERKVQKYSDENLPQCHVLYHTSDTTSVGFNPGLPSEKQLSNIG